MPSTDARNPRCPSCGSAATRLMTVAVNLFVPLYSCLNCDRLWRQALPPQGNSDKPSGDGRTGQHP
jgi:DNA-directed RNA polymerase subunit RPC12/RpoP